MSIELLTTTLGFSILAMLLSFALAPALTTLLYKYKIVRVRDYDPSVNVGEREKKVGTPIMGGLLVVITVTFITIAFNWDRSFTWVPIGVMLLSSLLGAIDDLLNIFGSPRRSQKLSHTLKLIRVHKYWHMRLWLLLTLPWALFKRSAVWLSSHPGRGLHVHEKLLSQFIAGGITAWWIFVKLGPEWTELAIPWDGFIDISWLIVPLIILLVSFTANAVNITDGLDGLAGGALITTFGALTFMSWVLEIPEMAILNATVLGALVTYTYFNIKPARFQMGDVGSLGLGALFAVNAIALGTIVIIPLLGFIFYVEAISVLLQIFWRYAFGKKLFKMAPLHHHFEMLGWSEEKVVMRFWLAHLAFVILGLYIGLQ